MTSGLPVSMQEIMCQQLDSPGDPLSISKGALIWNDSDHVLLERACHQDKTENGNLERRLIDYGLPKSLASSCCSSPYPIQKQFFAQVDEFSRILMNVLQGFVKEWQSNPAMLSLNPTAQNATLRSIAEYQRRFGSHLPLGSLRPDNLLPDSKDSHPDKGFLVCEINARFALNGYLIGHFGSLAMNDHSREQGSKTAFLSSLKDGLPDGLFGRFSLDQPVYVLKSREKGNDILMLQNLQLGYKFFFLDPLKEVVPKDACQFILELHQDEILQLPPHVLDQLIQGVCLNPIFTIFLLHDKRLLALLQEDWALYHISTKERDFLLSHIASTKLLSKTGSQMSKLHKDNWVLKPYGEGKGEGLVFGKDLDEKSWINLLEMHKLTDDFVLQEYVCHRQEPIRKNRETSFENLTVIGTFFTVDSQFFGISVWRASKGDIVAVARGGVWLIGCISEESSTNLLDTLDLTSDIWKKELLGKLEKDGLAILRCDSLNSNSLISLANVLGEPDEHSNGGELIWDIRSIRGSHARSHTMEEFEWHTDSSFEYTCPRWIILHVIQHDRFGGGTFRILSIEDIEMHLSEAEIQALGQDFEFVRPPEFFKKGHSATKRPILKDGTLRFRSDIVKGLDPTSSAALDRLREILSEKVKPSLELELEKGMLLILDNHRYLHSRTRILDSQRWLKRMRVLAKN